MSCRLKHVALKSRDSRTCKVSTCSNFTPARQFNFKFHKTQGQISGTCGELNTAIIPNFQEPRGTADSITVSRSHVNPL